MRAVRAMMFTNPCTSVEIERRSVRADGRSRESRSNRNHARPPPRLWCDARGKERDTIVPSVDVLVPSRIASRRRIENPE